MLSKAKEWKKKMYNKILPVFQCLAFPKRIKEATFKSFIQPAVKETQNLWASYCRATLLRHHFVLACMLHSHTMYYPARVVTTMEHRSVLLIQCNALYFLFRHLLTFLLLCSSFPPLASSYNPNSGSLPTPKITDLLTYMGFERVNAIILLYTENHYKIHITYLQILSSFSVSVFVIAGCSHLCSSQFSYYIFTSIYV